MENQQNPSAAFLPIPALSIGALSKTLIMIKRNLSKAQTPTINQVLKSPTETFDLSKRGDLHLFLFTLKKGLKTKIEEQIIAKTFNDFPFFQKIDPKVSSILLQGFSKYFEYISRPAGSTIYENGEEGDYLYIILSGTVYIMISKSGLMPSEQYNDSSPKSPKKDYPTGSPVQKNFSDEEEEKEGSPKEHMNTASILRRGSFFVKSSGFEKMNQEMERRSPSKKPQNLQRILKFINIKYPEYNIAQELGSGESFGEVALITNSQRHETVVCKEPCHFLRIDKKNYKKILMMNHARGLHELLDFFSKFDIFSHWPKSQLSTFLKFFQMNVFNNNDVLYKENDESTFLYFIKEGEVEISKLVHFDGNNEEESIHGNINKQSIFDIKKYQMYNQYWQESFHKKNHKRAKLAILGSGCYFGEEEFLANKLRVTKAVVKMKSVIYIIKNEFFSTNVKTKTTLDKISDEYKMKENWRNGLVKKGIKEEKHLSQAKTKSLHSETSSSNADFQDRVPYQSKLFVEAKKQVLQKRKEIFLKHQKLQEQFNQYNHQTIPKKLLNNSEVIKNQKPKFKLDLRKILNNENLISIQNKPLSMPTDPKRGKTARFSYLFKEEELSSDEKYYNTTTRKGINERKNSANDESKKNMKGKFARALEKLKIRKENNNNNTISMKSQETEPNQTKNQLQKLIQLMFRDKKKHEKIENFKEDNKKGKIKTVSRFFKESFSQLYLYNDSVQEKNDKTYGQHNSYTDRESKSRNIHVEKKKKQLSLRNNGSFRAMMLYKRDKNKGISLHHKDNI